jgi:hypothetical protein
MGRHGPLLPRPSRAARIRRAKAAAPADSPALPDDLSLVYGWLCRISPHPTEVEELLGEVLRRSREAAPVSLRATSAATRLQFLTVQSVLRWRGVI